MSRHGLTPPNAPGPCPEYAEACVLFAWGEAVSGEQGAHIEACPRCSAAVADQRALARSAESLSREPPARVREGLAEAVFAATTRRESQARRSPWVWSGAAVSVAAAGLAGVVWWRSVRPADEGMPDFTEVDLELLEDLDLAENLDLLEVLDALEEIDNA